MTTDLTNEELSKLDFPIAVERMLISTNAMLRTVLQNQMVILKALEVTNNDTIAQEMNQWIEENKNIVNESLKTNVPQSNWINYPKN